MTDQKYDGPRLVKEAGGEFDAEDLYKHIKRAIQEWKAANGKLGEGSALTLAGLAYVLSEEICEGAKEFKKDPGAKKTFVQDMLHSFGGVVKSMIEAHLNHQLSAETKDDTGA
ncbi:MAG: hypothetical protein GY952_13975 [Rhodobacteraceae bacterium]|nr:hypothetical protein [Paracoccaceae bacterium]